MSSDTTAKENASVVDSSITEGKHDAGNSDDPESSSYKVNEDNNMPLSKVKEAGQSRHQLERLVTNANERGQLYDIRYFIIKSLSHQNIQLSVERGIWATQVMNEPILDEAFHNSGRVILIFSVNMSGFFQGYAQMVSSVGWRKDNVWNQGTGRGNPWGSSFKVKWLRLNDLPFQKTLHLKNPLNDFKPVKISRDCQELPPHIGEALCELLDGNSDMDDSLKSFPRDEKKFVGVSTSLGDEEYNNAHLSNMPWAGTHMSYPSFLYQHHVGLNRYELGCQISGENLAVDSGMPKVAKTKKHPTADGKLSKLRVERDVSSLFDSWGLPVQSPLSSSLTEDDYLDMSYEEYLEAHDRSMKQVYGISGSMKEASRSKKTDDDLNSKFDADRDRSRKKARHPSRG
ncbi:hypothetical protein ACFE04_015452 [Oxalis oulophora]